MPTQELGRQAHASRKIAGLIAPSAKNSGGKNLVVFTDRLTLGRQNRLEVFDPYGNLAQRLP